MDSKTEAKVNPDRLASLDMTEEVYQFFGQLYGMDKPTMADKVKLDIHQLGDVAE